MATTDEMTSLIAFLRADAGVAALVGARVYEELPASEAANMPRKAVVIASAGLGSQMLTNRSWSRVTSSTKDVRCYGETLYQARLVYNAVNDALIVLRRRILSGVLVYGAFRTNGPQGLREATVNWPLVFASYDVAAAEVA